MKYLYKYIGFFALGILLFVLMISSSKSPETKIKGEWSELAWEYEKVDKNEGADSNIKEDSNYVKNTMGQDLVIHKAEKWKFYPDGKLILKGKKYTKEVSWCMKGRGNILELKYDDNNVEHYSLTELSDKKLVLNFDTETHTRGIARLTFEKIN